MLELQDMGFDYGNGLTILQHVNLQIGEGEFIGLGGRNGCGKTTVTRLIMGLETPREGDILYNGKSLKGRDAAARSRLIGYVFQRPERQRFRATVREEIAYGPQQLGMEPIKVRAAVREALEATGLTALANAYPPNLNRGEKQRVAIASAVAMHTKYLILDEPTSGQDSAEKTRLMALLQQLNRQGMTILLITHDMDILAQYCQRVIVMGHRTKAFDGTPEELFTSFPELTELGLTRPESVVLSQAVPGMKYCKSMEEFKNEMLKRLGGSAS